jgi:hypothetical protein
MKNNPLEELFNRLTERTISLFILSVYFLPSESCTAVYVGQSVWLVFVQFGSDGSVYAL